MKVNKPPKPKRVANEKRVQAKIEATPPTKVHDLGYKKIFSNRTIFRQLLETFIPYEWVHEIDFSTCETVKKSFISDHYKETESDLLYKIQVRGKTVYIYILLEFQSTVPRFMVVRVLNYLTSLYLDYVAEHTDIANLKLPAVFPIVIYNGTDRWNAPLEIDELIEDAPNLGNYALHFKYLLLNESAYSKEMLLQIRNIVSTLFLAEVHYDGELLRQELEKLYEDESDKQAVSILLNWFRQLVEHGRVHPDEYEKLDYVYKSREEVQTMLAATLELERKKDYQRILDKGRDEGREEGREEGQQALRKTIVSLLNYHFSLTAEEQAPFIQQLAMIETLVSLNAVIDGLLNREITLAKAQSLITQHVEEDQKAKEKQKATLPAAR